MIKSYFALTQQYLCPFCKIHLRTWQKLVVDISIFSPYYTRPPLLVFLLLLLLLLLLLPRIEPLCLVQGVIADLTIFRSPNISAS
jgi:hypothetical protein